MLQLKLSHLKVCHPDPLLQGLQLAEICLLHHLLLLVLRAFLPHLLLLPVPFLSGQEACHPHHLLHQRD